MAKELSDAGYTKVDTGNTELSDKSEILSNDADKLKTIKQDLNIKENDEKENKKEYKDYDVIIILGKDFETFGK